MQTKHDYRRTLRVPETAFPMRALDAASPEVAAADQARLAALLPGRDPAELYRKLRNCFRWLLGSLAHRTSEMETPGEMPPLERYMWGLLARVQSADLSHDGLLRAVSFALDDLSPFYFDVRKDALYCDPEQSVRRLASLEFMEAAFTVLVRMLAFGVPNLCSEASSHREPHELRLGFCAEHPAHMAAWDSVRQARKTAGAFLENLRVTKRMNSSLDAHLDLLVSDWPHWLHLKASGWDAAEVLCVSSAYVAVGEPGGEEWRMADVPWLGLSFRPADGQPCARSFRRSHDVGSNPRFPDLSPRDAEAVKEFESKNP